MSLTKKSKKLLFTPEKKKSEMDSLLSFPFHIWTATKTETNVKKSLAPYPHLYLPRLLCCRLCKTKEKISLEACSKCGKVRYCSKGCQQRDWIRHELACYQNHNLNLSLRCQIEIPLEAIFIPILLNDVKQIILKKNVHPNYIYLTQKRLLPERENIDSFHFFWIFVDKEIHCPLEQTTSLLDFIMDFDMVVPTEVFSFMSAFHRQIFILLQKLTDIVLWIPCNTWSIQELLWQIDGLSWFLERASQVEIDDVKDRLQQLSLTCLQNLATESLLNLDCKRALAWLLTQNYAEPLIKHVDENFPFIYGPLKLGFQNTKTYLKEQTDLRKKKFKPEVLIILRITDLVDICWSYLEMISNILC